MKFGPIYSTELCEHVRELEELLECRIAALVLVEGPGDLVFAVPGGASELVVREVLRRVSAAAQDALKPL